MKIISLKLGVSLLAALLFSAPPARAQDPGRKTLEQPVIVNGDTVEYKTERSEITAKGNVRVDYKGTRLTCDGLTVNTVTKDAVAEGRVVIEDKNGFLRGERIVYNLNTKKGSVQNGSAASPPFFFRSDKINMKNEREFISERGYFTSCSLDHPHYRVRTKKARMVSGERLQTYSDTFLAGGYPLLYLPYYSQSLKDPFMHVQLTPGYRKQWGYFLLSAWRFDINEFVNGRLYLDYRSRLGLAEGVGAGYHTPFLGKGDVKVYYTNEQPETEQGGPGEFERWFTRWRHQWQVDPRTYYMSDFYRIMDEKREDKGSAYNFLKDYFPREYDQDSQPPSYALLHRSFELSSLDVLVQSRSSKWYDYVERLPEVRYTLPDAQLTEGRFPLYFQDTTQFANLRKSVISPASAGSEYSVVRLDTYNQFSSPFRAGFADLTPFAGLRNTAYSSAVGGDSIGPRTIIYSGVSASTKFYRIFETTPRFLGMDIDDVRHIITPTFDYTYNSEPTVKSAKLRQFDGIDAIGENSSVGLGLSNRLQTKRNGSPVDFFDFRVNSSYIFWKVDPTTDERSGGRLSDLIEFKLDFDPYSWVQITGDSNYNQHTGYFETGNYDVAFLCGESRKFGFGQRYQRKGGSEFVSGLDWKLNPKWTFHTYHRYQFKENAPEPPGFVRHEYGFTRDLHCWLVDLTFTSDKEEGNSFWVIFRMKAFPEAQVSFTKSYNAPKRGSN